MGMTSCKRIGKKLSAYQDGELSFEQQVQIEAHLQDCKACGRQFATMEQAWEDMELISEIRPEASFYMKLEHKLELESEPIFLGKLRDLFYMLPNPALALVLILMGIMFGIYAGNTLTQDGFRPMPHRENIYAQGITLSSLSAFDPLPPGTLAAGYIRLANHQEGAHQ